MSRNINAVIIEDEIPAARLLYSMTAALRPQWEVTIIPGSVDEAVDWFGRNPHPDLIFLDIHLADGNAFNFLTAARPESAVIFTTAYDQYALQAFKVNSIDYILKPFDEDRLSEAIAKFEKMKDRSWIRSESYLESILEALQHPEKKYRTRFLICDPDLIWSLQVDDIAYFYSENRITTAVTSGGKEHIIDLSLNRLEVQLMPDRFFRVNRQMIVNIDAIDHAVPFPKGKILVKVIPEFRSEIIVSEEKSASFRRWLNY